MLYGSKQRTGYPDLRTAALFLEAVPGPHPLSPNKQRPHTKQLRDPLRAHLPVQGHVPGARTDSGSDAGRRIKAFCLNTA